MGKCLKVQNIETVSNPSYSGGERAARDLELLSEKNIRAVVNCTDDLRLIK